MTPPTEAERRCDGCQFYMAAMKAVWMGRYWGKREEQPRWGGCKKQRLAGNQDVSRYRAAALLANQSGEPCKAGNKAAQQLLDGGLADGEAAARPARTGEP